MSFREFAALLRFTQAAREQTFPARQHIGQTLAGLFAAIGHFQGQVANQATQAVFMLAVLEHQGLEELADALQRLDPGVVEDRPVAGFDRGPVFLEDLCREVFLAGEVVVERALGNLGSGGDVLDAAAVEATVVNHLAANRQQTGSDFEVDRASHDRDIQ